MPLYQLPKKYHPDFRLPNVKPTGSFTVDTSHPYCPDVVIIPTMEGDLVDLVTGETFPRAADASWTSYGYRTSTSTALMNRVYNSDGRGSLLMDMTSHDSVSGSDFFGYGNAGNGGLVLGIQSNSGKTLSFFRDGSGSNLSIVTSSNAFAVDVPFTIGYTYEGGLGPCTLIVDDAEYTGSQGSGSAKTFPSTDWTLTPDGYDKSWRYLYMWRNPVSTEVLHSLRRDPFQILKPKENYYSVSSGGTDVNQALTGVSGTGSVGTVSTAVDADVTPTGVNATGSVGTLTTASDVAATPTGVSGTGQVGSVSVLSDASASPTGVDGTGQVGSLGVQADVTPSLTGVSGTGSPGTLTTLTGTIATPTGVSATGQVGSLSIEADATISITGVAGTGAAGTLTVSTGENPTLLGVSATGQVGSFVVLADATLTLTGVQATSSVGNLTTIQSASATLTGVAGTGAVGTLTIDQDATVSLTGVQGTSGLGTLIASEAGAVLTGAQATGAAGDLTVGLYGSWIVQGEDDGSWSVQAADSTVWTEQDEDDTTWT